ncbi:hypothetical protein, partial [Thiolapillus sp.]
VLKIDTLGNIEQFTAVDDASVSGLSLAMGRQGTLIIGETDCALRLHYPDGHEQRVVLDADNRCQATPDVLVRHPDGHLLIAGTTPASVQRLQLSNETPRPGYRIADTGGQGVFWFDDHGRHLKTTEADGSLRYQFSYGAAGYLKSVTDAHGQSLQIDRGAGKDSDIHLIMPDGSRITLKRDAAGHLKQIVNANTRLWSAPHPLGNTAQNKVRRSFRYSPPRRTSATPYRALPVVRSDISPPVGDTRLVASLPGEFGVSPRGGAGYSIP